MERSVASNFHQNMKKTSFKKCFFNTFMGLLFCSRRKATPHAYDKKSSNFAQGLDFLRFQVAIYTVFHEESESEVEKCEILEPGGKKWKIYPGIPGS